MLQFKSIHEANAVLDTLADGQRVAVMGRIGEMDKSLGALRFKCEQQVVKYDTDRRQFSRGKQGKHQFVAPIGG